MNRDAIKVAAEWYARLRADEASADDSAAHARWLAAHADHRWAWQQVQALCGKLGSLPGPMAASTLNLARNARTTRRNVLKGLALTLTAGGAGWLGVRESPALTAAYRTATGERRSFTLVDGSTLFLNTGSSADVLYDAGQRLVRLHAGEILIQSAPDIVPLKRPLRVQTRDGLIEALGTRFTVRQLSHATRVGVEQHAVELQPVDGKAPPYRLVAGEQAEFSRTTIQPTASPMVETGAWANGMLIVADMPLAVFATELARYRPGFLACTPEIAQLRISGAFPVDDTERALAAVARALPVRIRHFTRYWTRIEAAT